jgi:uncharacterized phage-associated protein
MPSEPIPGEFKFATLPPTPESLRVPTTTTTKPPTLSAPPSGTSYTLAAEAGRLVATGAPAKLHVKNSALTAKIVASLILEVAANHGDVLTNLKLQKLLYYVQAWYLALHDRPLFAEKFEASDLGPIEPTAFREFSAFVDQPIRLWVRNLEPPKAIRSHIEEVLEVYGRFSAFDLERLARDEEPWKAARLSLENRGSATISNDVMKQFYKLRIG